VSPEGGAVALERLGVGWVDASELVRVATTGAEFSNYLSERYPPVFTP
jgi:hypothetical protein